MSKEIEKKFKVKKLPLELLKDIAPLELIQTYLESPPNEERRVRSINNEKFVTTIKKATNSENVREEIEKEISQEDYEVLLKQQIGTQIHKKRYKIQSNDELTYELDIYTDTLEGLIVVEVEFETEEMANSFVKPNWFGEEVTSDKRYKNVSLAKNGMPEGHGR